MPKIRMATATLAGTFLLACAPLAALAQEAPAAESAGAPSSSEKPEENARIRDNLFLLEEAYNQEPGVIQHVSVFQYLTRSKGFGYSFTEEWPVGSDLHQLSLTLGIGRVDGESRVGFMDSMISYRVQALGLGGKGLVAMAPRISVLLPTGRNEDGLGRGVFGFQVNLPVSVELGRYFVMHLNAGATLSPGVDISGGPSGVAVDANAGAAVVFQPLPWANALVEVAYNTTDDFELTGRRRSHALVVNPGVRFAIDVGNLQVVPGIAVPMQVLEKQGFEVGVLGYLSFEHPI